MLLLNLRLGLKTKKVWFPDCIESVKCFTTEEGVLIVEERARSEDKEEEEDTEDVLDERGTEY